MSSNQTPLKRKRTYSEDIEMSGKNSSSISFQDRQSSSPDMFADSLELLLSDSDLFEDALDKQQNISPETDQVHLSWRGISIEELRSGCGFWGYQQLPPIQPSHNHAVLFQFPVPKGDKPAPLQRTYVDKWDSEHVRMPFSPQNLYPIADNTMCSKNSARSVWELVEESLLRQIMSAQQLEAAILSYCGTNSRNWDFTTLHHFLSDVLNEAEVECFFSQLLPSMIQLALQLPSLIKSSIPLLKQFKNSSISLSQLQIASLLSNAFFCTFPRRNTIHKNSEYVNFPDINFNRLYQGSKKKSSQRAIEKLKCILHYFRRVCHKAPEGVVTFTRRYIPTENLPSWGKSSKLLNKLCITSTGTIEDEGKGMLQVDFANKRIGGGVLHWGCVQEEIRFVICPELIVTRLFTESMEPLEALHIAGCERFSSYKGYGDSFEWVGDYNDNTPRDSSGRLLCTVTAIDAMAFRNPNFQYTAGNIARELNKAYVGFSSPDIPEEQRSPVATGNWGCGVYRGNAKLKSLLQLMAASQAGRHLVYFTFGNEKLRDEVFNMYTFLTKKQVTIGRLWQCLQQYPNHCLKDGKVSTELYTYLYSRLSESESATHSSGSPQSAKFGNSVTKASSRMNIHNQSPKLSPEISIFKQKGDSRSETENSTGTREKSGTSSISLNSAIPAEEGSKIVSKHFTSHGNGITQMKTVKDSETLMMEIDSEVEEKYISDDSLSAPKLVSSINKTSLLQQLEMYDKPETPKSIQTAATTTTTPTTTTTTTGFRSSNSTTNSSKKKISDYFNVVHKDKSY